MFMSYSCTQVSVAKSHNFNWQGPAVARRLRSTSTTMYRMGWSLWTQQSQQLSLHCMWHYNMSKGSCMCMKALCFCHKAALCQSLFCEPLYCQSLFCRSSDYEPLFCQSSLYQPMCSVNYLNTGNLSTTMPPLLASHTTTSPLLQPSTT